MPVVHPHVRAPFGADFEEVRVLRRPDGTAMESRLRWRIYRDGAGRTRSEMPLEGLGFLVDPRAGHVVLVDLVSGRTLQDAPGPPAASAVAERLGPEAANWPRWPKKGPPQVEELPSMVVDGIVARGRRLTFADGVVETWSATELIDPAVLTRCVTEREEYEGRLSNIRLGDPDPSLFAPLGGRSG